MRKPGRGKKGKITGNDEKKGVGVGFWGGVSHIANSNRNWREGTRRRKSPNLKRGKKKKRRGDISRTQNYKKKECLLNQRAGQGKKNFKM